MVVSLNANIGRGVIPTAPPRNAHAQAFQGVNNTSFSGEEQKESFLHKYRGTIGFFVGMVSGEVLFHKCFAPKMLKSSGSKKFFTQLGCDFVLGFIGQLTAEIMGQKKQG